MTDAANRNYVWYVSYGSNIWRERFMCYIKGGTPAGGAREYEGCEDKTDPLDERNLTLNGRLYFAGRSKTWHGGGVAFFDNQAHGGVLARAYLISFEQFLDVVAQENRQDSRPDLIFSVVTANREFDTGLKSFYPLLLNLGELDGHPMLTFTARERRADLNLPEENYLIAISRGIVGAYDMPESEARKYLQRFI